MEQEGERVASDTQPLRFGETQQHQILPPPQNFLHPPNHIYPWQVFFLLHGSSSTIAARPMPVTSLSNSFPPGFAG